MAAIIILLCLGLVTIMLCGTSAENIARILSILGKKKNNNNNFIFPFSLFCPSVYVHGWGFLGLLFSP
jgi:hypothetical protein